MYVHCGSVTALFFILFHLRIIEEPLSGTMLFFRQRHNKLALCFSQKKQMTSAHISPTKSSHKAPPGLITVGTYSPTKGGTH